MTEKLIIKAESQNKNTGYCPVFLSSEYHGKIKEISESTGISMRKLTETMIDFAIENLEVQPSKDGKLPK